MSATPYWGELPASSLQAPRRNSVRRSAEIPKDDQTSNPKRASGNQRLSVSTMDSNSQIISPTASYFPDALAPRPPSFPYGAHEYQDGQPKKRRQRNSQDGEKLPVEQPLPAATTASDAHHAPPPLSYKAPYSKGLLSSQIPVRSKSTRRTGEPVEVQRDKEAQGGNQNTSSANGTSAAAIKDIPKGNILPRRSQKSDYPIAQDDSFDARRDLRTTSHSNSKTATATEIDSKRQREWAPDRSPLQRLELALGSLTKEEKRARAEEAERLAQVMPQRTTSISSRVQNERPVASRFPEPTQSELPPVREAAGTYRKQKADVQQVKKGEQDMPSRGVSFRERAALALGTGVATGATIAGDGSLNRSSSKKLRKEPPGDPWYNRRKDAESTPRDVRLKRGPNGSENIAAEDSTDDELPVHKKSSKFEQIMGRSTSVKNKSIANKPFKNVAFATERENESIAEKLEENSQRPRHHLSNFVPGHHARDRYKPGQGLYLPPTPLKEWKQGSTGFLSAAYLDLDAKQTEIEKNKAWWEVEDSGKLRSRPPRTRHDRRYDGENEDNNGTVFSKFSAKEDSPFATQAPIERWPQIQDPVVPPAREYIGYEGTSANPRKVQRRSKSWGRDPSELPHKSQRSIKAPGIIFPYSFKCPSRSEQHNILYPFHLCPDIHPSKNKQLTASIRARPITAPTSFKPSLFLKCGPLLRYKGIRREPDTSLAARKKGITEREIWRGSVLIVTTDEYSDYVTPPTLRLFSQPVDLPPPPPVQVDGPIDNLPPEYVDPIVGLPKIGRDGSTLYVRPVEELDVGIDLSRNETDEGLFERQRVGGGLKGGLDGSKDAKGSKKRDGEKVGKYLEVPGLRLDVEQGLTFWRFNIEVELASKSQRIAYRINRGPATGFWVPARGEAMNIMFYSCNGFTNSVDPDPYSGPDPLWRDVLNSHQTRPFHCMIGGGDQLYNDTVMTETELFQDWLNLKNPITKHNTPFTADMQLELETFYFNRYCMWFSQGLFGLANSQIPMINIFDDHDIIDGFGSYPDGFMGSPVFMGLGAIAYRAYLLFQHHTIIDEGEETEPSWIIGHEPGPWIGQHSRSLYLSLGKSIAFVGLDCRTERKRDEIVSKETYDKVFERCRKEIRSGETKHLILLLGVPIAYPRLVWLENLLTSRLLDPIRAAGRMGLFKNFINEFDGGVEILDDLDDHWCALNHKAERNWLIEELQTLAAEKSVRVTILGGDVHLGAIGRFYSNPSLHIPKDHDFRYMPNIVSSAIVNEPPPSMMADMMNKRNKVHHLNRDTDESMVPIFTHDVDNKPRNNKCLLPRRNWCSINVYLPSDSPPPTPPATFDGNDRQTPSPQLTGGSLRRRDPRGPSYTPDASSRPPLSGGLMRKFSRSRGRSSTDGDRPNVLTRTLSLSRKDFTPSNIFRRNSSKRRPDDGGINGYGAESEETLPNESQTSIANSSHFSTRLRRNHETTRSDGNINSSNAQVHQRGGAGGDEERPNFHRTPTELARKGQQQSINLEGGLEITLNVEREQGDPAGITVPYQFLVPALWYDVEDDGIRSRRPSALQRLKSFGKGRMAHIDR